MKWLFLDIFIQTVPKFNSQFEQKNHDSFDWILNGISYLKLKLMKFTSHRSHTKAKVPLES